MMLMRMIVLLLSFGEEVMAYRNCAWDIPAIELSVWASIETKSDGRTGGVAPSFGMGCGATRALDLPGLSVQNQPILRRLL